MAIMRDEIKAKICFSLFFNTSSLRGQTAHPGAPSPSLLPMLQSVS